MVGGRTDDEPASLQGDAHRLHPDAPPAPKPGEEDTHVVCASPEVDEPRVVGLFEDYDEEDDE